MGQKVHPRAFRIGTIYGWKSKWFSSKKYAAYLEQDVKIRKYLYKKHRQSGIANIEVERSGDDLTVNMYTAKPGILIGRGGAGSEELKKEIKKNFYKSKGKLNLNIFEVDKHNLSAPLICQSIIVRRIINKSYFWYSII